MFTWTIERQLLIKTCGYLAKITNPIRKCPFESAHSYSLISVFQFLSVSFSGNNYIDLVSIYVCISYPCKGIV